MNNEVASEGQVYVCAACGKRSKDIYGKQKIDSGWDISCTMHAILCKLDSLLFKDGRVIKAEAVQQEKDNGSN